MAMMGKPQPLGAWGEALARNYLERCGYRCLDAGYRLPGGEIDLVMVRGEELIFVEVKTRGPGAVAPPESWVDGRKLRLLRRAVRGYLMRRPPGGPFYLRLDVVGIQDRGEGRGLVLRHYPGVG